MGLPWFASNTRCISCTSFTRFHGRHAGVAPVTTCCGDDTGINHVLLVCCVVQDPGRVWKGKKMPGLMGQKTITQDGLRVPCLVIFVFLKAVCHSVSYYGVCLQVYKIDLKRNLMYVIGCVPGTKGAYVYVKDCAKIIEKKRDKGTPLPPFPTAPTTIPDIVSKIRGKQAKLEWIMEPTAYDPFAMHDWEEPEPV